MEIERVLQCYQWVFLGRETKKISWKWRLKGYFNIRQCSFYQFGNKENLLKMEIESSSLKNVWHSAFEWRNKENLLKMEIERPYTRLWNTWVLLRNKENLLKMEIESFQRGNKLRLEVSKQRKSPENGDWKERAGELVSVRAFEKQRKSPENGDWKLKWLKNGSKTLWVWNKENLLKMEIESYTDLC